MCLKVSGKIKILKAGKAPELKPTPELGEPKMAYKRLSVTEIQERWFEEHRLEQEKLPTLSELFGE